MNNKLLPLKKPYNRAEVEFDEKWWEANCQISVKMNLCCCREIASLTIMTWIFHDFTCSHSHTMHITKITPFKIK